MCLNNGKGFFKVTEHLAEPAANRVQTAAFIRIRGLRQFADKARQNPKLHTGAMSDSDEQATGAEATSESDAEVESAVSSESDESDEPSSDDEDDFGARTFRQ